MKSTFLLICLLSAPTAFSQLLLSPVSGSTAARQSLSLTAAALPGAGPDVAPSATDKTAPRADGKELYGVYCVNCHGSTGKGDGIAAGSLKPRPKPFKDSLKAMSDAQILEVIAKGKGQMPGWGNVLSDDQQKAILDHIKGLARS